MEKQLGQLYYIAQKNHDLELQFTILKEQTKSAQLTEVNLETLLEMCSQLGLDKLANKISTFLKKKNAAEKKRGVRLDVADSA